MAKAAKTTTKPALTESEKAAKQLAKAGKFVSVGQPRVTKAVKAIGILANLSNKNTYAYTQEQVDKMIAALAKAVNDVKNAFSVTGGSKADDFTF